MKPFETLQYEAVHKTCQQNTNPFAGNPPRGKSTLFKPTEKTPINREFHYQVLCMIDAERQLPNTDAGKYEGESQ